MVYRSTDRLGRHGAAVENMAHSAFLQHDMNNAPSKPGIKHLAWSAWHAWLKQPWTRNGRVRVYVVLTAPEVAERAVSLAVQADPQGLADAHPIFTWVRLAQRIPVRIKFDAVPYSVRFVAGLTATVAIDRRLKGGD